MNDLSIAILLGAVAYLVMIGVILHLVSFNKQREEIEDLRARLVEADKRGDGFPYYD